MAAVEVVSDRTNRARLEGDSTHPTILSHVLRTYFFCSTPSRTIPTTVTQAFVNSWTYSLSELTYSASFHGLRDMALNGASTVSSSSRKIASRAAEIDPVKSSFSASRDTRS